MADSAEQKAALRARFRAYRTGLGAEERAARSARIAAHAAALPEVAEARTIHAYWPMEAHGEVDVRPLLVALAREGRRVVLPVVASFEPGRPRLEHRLFTGEAGLRANRWGVEEPTAGPPVPPEEVDVVLVPALAAGRDGRRLGQGGGYYDAFLRACPAPAVGLVYAATLLDTLPAEAHDVPLDVVVTEDGALRPDVTSPPPRRTASAV